MAPFTAFSRSQSEKMMSGDLPPSSKVTGLIPLADSSMILENKDKHSEAGLNSTQLSLNQQSRPGPHDPQAYSPPYTVPLAYSRFYFTEPDVMACAYNPSYSRG